MVIRKKGSKPVIWAVGKIYKHPCIVYEYSKQSKLHCIQDAHKFACHSSLLLCLVDMSTFVFILFLLPVPWCHAPTSNIIQIG
jgi:hypothetical protein